MCSLRLAEVVRVFFFRVREFAPRGHVYALLSVVWRCLADIAFDEKIDLVAVESPISWIAFFSTGAGGDPFIGLSAVAE